ncbi:MAG TPA: hypothetical protein VND24_05625 [Steroidobacteraceae bacterium]|nr:hypothetical protein [Steroidobacteraceae bacterium]
MSSTDRGRGSAPATQKDPPAGEAPAADRAEPFPGWLDRMQRARVRHAAITRNLNTWSSYKTWADRMRESWEEEERPPDGEPRGAGGNKSPGG